MQRKTALPLQILFGLFSILLITGQNHLHAQAVSATRGGGSYLTVGGTFNIAKPDYGTNTLYGVGGYADFNINRWIGIEGELRYLNFNKVQNISERNYFIGPRFTYRRGRFEPYVKGMFGLGGFTYPSGFEDSYEAGAFGGGLDYHLTRKIALRGEVESQLWNFPAGTGGLTPTVFSVGASYRIF